MSKLIGYHYTSYDNWRQIQKTGLIPYKIDKAEINRVLKVDSVQGIWIWQDKQEGLAHRGCIMFQMGTKATTRVVQLKVKYDLDKALSPLDEPDRLVVIPHQGNIGELMYHTWQNNETGIIITETIPASDISLIATYDLMEVWNV